MIYALLNLLLEEAKYKHTTSAEWNLLIKSVQCRESCVLVFIIIFFGASETTRGPIEMFAALLLAALVLFFRALMMRRSQ